MAESLLDALEGSLRIFEKHRVLILGQLASTVRVADRPSGPDRPGEADGKESPGHAEALGS